MCLDKELLSDIYAKKGYPATDVKMDLLHWVPLNDKFESF